jgi:DNA-binding GntR family transcriptional regulator
MKKTSGAFVNQIVLWLILTIGLGGGVGLGVVWMRHKISTTANNVRKLAAERAEVDRLISEKSAFIASEQRPDLLRKLNDEFHLGLVPMSDVTMFNESSEGAIRGLVQRSTRDLMERPPSVTLKLAQH